MAKRKPANSGKSKSARSPKSKTSASRDGQPSAVKSKAATAGQRPMTGIEIGHVAGEVWAALEKDGEQTLAAIKKSVDAPADTVLAAVGWLAREDKLDFVTSGQTVKIALRHRD